MKKFTLTLVVISALGPSVSQAQVKIDVNRITCGEVLAMGPEDQIDFAAWLSGWYAFKSNRTFIDMGYFQKNFASVKDWCASNKDQSIMAGLERAFNK